jgi:hypothetical protein
VSKQRVEPLDEGADRSIHAAVSMASAVALRRLRMVCLRA